MKTLSISVDLSSRRLLVWNNKKKSTFLSKHFLRGHLALLAIVWTTTLTFNFCNEFVTDLRKPFYFIFLAFNWAFRQSSRLGVFSGATWTADQRKMFEKRISTYSNASTENPYERFFHACSNTFTQWTYYNTHLCRYASNRLRSTAEERQKVTKLFPQINLSLHLRY